MDWQAVDRFAKALIKEAGHQIRNSFSGQIQIESKSNMNDLVTNIDQEIEQFLIGNIQDVYPNHLVLSEEGFGDDVKALTGVVWILDPIDGTMNFVHQKESFAISIGVYMDGVGILGYIYDVVGDKMYTAQKGAGAYVNDERLPNLTNGKAENAIVGVNSRWLAPNRYINGEKLISIVRDCRGTRSYGSAALEIAYVASGKLDAYISGRLSPWDIAGGIVIAREVGAIASNLVGDAPDLLQPNSLLIARPCIHEALLTYEIEA